MKIVMLCSHCGKCCERTEMPLSEADVERLEKAGYRRELFMRYDKHSFARLRNCKGYCVFYNVKKHRCKVYKYRPLGCRIYPVIYSEEDGIIVDDLCPMGDTVSNSELKRKGRRLISLLKVIEDEAKHSADFSWS